MSPTKPNGTGGNPPEVGNDGKDVLKLSYGVIGGNPNSTSPVDDETRIAQQHQEEDAARKKEIEDNIECLKELSIQADQLKKGNTIGVVLPKTCPNPNPPSDKPETKEKESFLGKASPWVHGGLGLVSFVPGLSVLSGAIYAVIFTAEGDYVEAALSAASMVPGGKIATTVGKGAVKGYKLTKGVLAAEEAAKLAKGGGTLVRDGTAVERGVPRSARS